MGIYQLRYKNMLYECIKANGLIKGVSSWLWIRKARNEQIKKVENWFKLEDARKNYKKFRKQ